MSEPPSLSVEAWESVRASESRAGVVIREVTDTRGATDARAIFDAVWPSLEGGTQVPPNLLVALLHAGGYACVAYVDEEPVGATLGLAGTHGGLHIHSHMAGVVEPYRNRHIGTAMKLHQRAWCLEHGIDTVIWTFDPLVKRNARLNVTKLGVYVEGYEPDFYGEMPDAINAGDPTDRVFAVWRLRSARVRDALSAPLPPVVADADDLVIEIPDDIVTLRRRDPVDAHGWRMRVREQFRSALDRGLAVRGVDTRGDYVLGVAT